jgi:hypothetical protein
MCPPRGEKRLESQHLGDANSICHLIAVACTTSARLWVCYLFQQLLIVSSIMYTPNRIEWCTVFLFYNLYIRTVRLTWVNARLQAVLGAYVGKQGLDRHLDADEAVSLGAALQAANLSDGFKLNRKIGMVDGSTYGIVNEMDGATLESEDQKLLIPRMKKLPSKLFRSLKNQKQDFKCILKYDETDVLPPSSTSPVIAKYEISGVAEAAAKYVFFCFLSTISHQL